MWYICRNLFPDWIVQKYEPKTNRIVVIENKINGVNNDVIIISHH